MSPQEYTVRLPLGVYFTFFFCFDLVIFVVSRAMLAGKIHFSSYALLVQLLFCCGTLNFIVLVCNHQSMEIGSLDCGMQTTYYRDERETDAIRRTLAKEMSSARYPDSEQMTEDEQLTLQ